jgi:hypothetical protein
VVFADGVECYHTDCQIRENKIERLFVVGLSRENASNLFGNCEVCGGRNVYPTPISRMICNPESGVLDHNMDIFCTMD